MLWPVEGSIINEVVIALHIELTTKAAHVVSTCRSGVKGHKSNNTKWMQSNLAKGILLFKDQKEKTSAPSRKHE